MKKLLCLLIFLTSCATYEKYARYLDGFIGIDKVGLIDAWGVPDKTYQVDKDTEYLTYKQSFQTYIPGNSYTNNYGTYSYTNYTPGYVVNEWCDTTFVVQKNKVTKWQTQGDSCVKY